MNYMVYGSLKWIIAIIVAVYKIFAQVMSSSITRILCILLWSVAFNSSAQYIIKGKVTEIKTGDPIPFAQVLLKGTGKGAVTDFDGYYEIRTSALVDSAVCSHIGHQAKAKKLQAKKVQVIDFQLASSEYTTKAIVINSGENPAFEIIRRAVRNKEKNSIRSLKAYEYESYNKLELDVNNLSEKFKKRKVIKKIQALMDSIQVVAGDDGKPVLPVFISESVSKFYFRYNPQMQREEIQKTKVTGIGLDDGSTISQFIGSSFQQYNFYDNWLNILTKNFASPIGDAWKVVYDYDLLDSVALGDDFCYYLRVFPRRSQDLAFTGFIWITKDEYALKRVDLATTRNSNINFVEGLKIQQELTQSDAGPWVPVKNRITIDIDEFSKQIPGMIAKFYTSNRNITVNEPKPEGFYRQPVEVLPDAKIASETYWDTARHDTLSPTEKNIFKMIDTVRKLPIVKTYIDIADIAINGYYNTKYIEIGPYINSYAFNNIEGHRFRIGGRTSYNFSKKLLAKGYAAYGTQDEKLKYGFDVAYTFENINYTTLRYQQSYDLEQLALSENLQFANPLFVAFNRLGNLNRTRPFYQHLQNVSLSSIVARGLTLKVGVERRSFIPEYNFGFLSDVNRSPSNPVILNNYMVGELQTELRYARFEYFLKDDNLRIPVDTQKWPVFLLRYARGFNKFIGGDLDYHKFTFSIDHRIKTGILGYGRYIVESGYIPSRVPYPILRNHLGNQSLLYNPSSFNMMNIFEFVSDRYASLRYEQYFEGLLLNSIPTIKKLKWRFLAQGKILVGGVSNENRLINTLDNTASIETLGRTPYMEVGYGIENIFKLLRVDFVHRLNYLDRPNIRRFGVFVSVQFQL